MASAVRVQVIRNDFPSAAVKLRTRSFALSEQTAKRIAETARQKAPRRTGHLADDSIEAVKQGITWMVIAETADGEHDEYAGYVEYGANGRAPHPFMRPAFEQERPTFLGELGKLLGQLV